MDGNVTDIIYEKCTSCCVACPQSNEPSLLVPLSIIVGMIVTSITLGFSIYKYTKSQKEHNQKQEAAQEQFNQTQEEKKNIEFVKQIEKYATELNLVFSEFNDSDRQYRNCNEHANRILGILNRIAYLKNNGFVKQNFIQYFENGFNSGKSFLAWLEFTSPKNHWMNHFPDFRKLKDTLHYVDDFIHLPPEFYYYVHQMSINPKYDPRTDMENSSVYNVTQEDIDLIKPE